MAGSSEELVAKFSADISDFMDKAAAMKAALFDLTGGGGIDVA